MDTSRSSLPSIAFPDLNAVGVLTDTQERCQDVELELAQAISRHVRAPVSEWTSNIYIVYKTARGAWHQPGGRKLAVYSLQL